MSTHKGVFVRCAQGLVRRYLIYRDESVADTTKTSKYRKNGEKDKYGKKRATSSSNKHLYQTLVHKLR